MKPDEGANVMEMAEPVFEYYDKDKDGIIVLSELLPRDELWKMIETFVKCQTHQGRK